MQEILITRTPGFKNLYDVTHFQWIDGHCSIVKVIDSEVAFDYAIDLKEYHDSILFAL